MAGQGQQRSIRPFRESAEIRPKRPIFA
ncbi:hypothetical protein SAMN05444158_0773 [Bradyrhizobium canariense]|uniref:Uncharacterized protein n=1 Tax=Bradyrhizobium canariense TaxID=255045 RepID=A0A1H1NX16_9BRAD|nr:hypothetical protein SAMN05444158_0773 [Bradyrhizobium canariense]